MTLRIRSVPEDPGIITDLFINPVDGELLALDDDGYDRMGLVNRAFLRDYLMKHDKLAQVPVYIDPVAAVHPEPEI